MLKEVKKTLIIFLTYIIIPLNVYAYSDYIIASGKNIGIELKSNGVMIVGLYKLGDTYPGLDAGLKEGDIIVSIDDNKITNVDDLINIVSNIEKEDIKITYLRDDIKNYTNLKLYKENNISKTGLYIKDSITGIGTLTYIDPNTLIFGALGHEVGNTSNRIEVKEGNIYPSIVTGIDPSLDGRAGEKNARYDTSIVLGEVDENTIHGVFGKYTSEVSKTNLYQVGKPNVVHKGKAKILTVLDNDEVEEFEINIIKVNSNNKQTTKNILFEITDQRLLDITGGIIQGMSGSPIIQDNYIIGAVTHVIVDNPKRGYGIFITNMLEEGEN